MYRWFLYKVKQSKTICTYSTVRVMITHMHFLNTFILCGYYTVWGDEGPTSWKVFSNVLHTSEELSLSSRGSQLWPFLSRARVLSVITWQFAPVQPVEKFCGGSRDRAHRWAWLSPEINQHLVLIRRCWCAGCRVTPDESECVITFLCSRLFRLRSTSNEACILWEALEVAVSGDNTEGKEEGREHLIPPPHTVLKPHVVCWWGKRFMR